MTRVLEQSRVAVPAGRNRSRAVGLLAIAWLLTVGAACGQATTSEPTRTANTSLTSCEQAFRHWVAQSASLNSPEADLVGILIDQEVVQRRIFELCTLEQAERFNREVLVERAPGFSEPMIEPDFRTFAEIECVDEAPLLDGTPLCAEVAR